MSKQKKKKKTGRLSFKYEVFENYFRILVKSPRQKKFRVLQFPERFLKFLKENQDYYENKDLIFLKGDKISKKDKAFILWYTANFDLSLEQIFQGKIVNKILRKMYDLEILVFNEDFHEKHIMDYQPIFVEYNIENQNLFFMKDIKIYKSSSYFYFEGNESQLFRLGEKECNFIISFYKQYKRLPSSEFFLVKSNSEKLKKWIQRENCNFAVEKEGIGKLESLFGFISEETIEVIFGMKTSFVEDNGKFYFKKFNEKLYNEILSQLNSLFIDYKEERKRINFCCDFETALLVFNILDEHKNELDFYMDEEMMSKIKGKAKISFNMFKNNELGVPGFDVKNISLTESEKYSLLDKVRRGQIEKKDGKRYVKLSGDKILEIENTVNEILQIEDELSNYDSIRLNGKMSKVEKARFAMSDIAFNNLEVEKEREIINNFENVEPLIPFGVNATLFDYQKKGFAWIYELFSNGYGGILGDDMGLGKTLQVISFIKKILLENPKNKILIVAPTSLVNNWRDEFSKFTDIVPHFIYSLGPKQLKSFLKTYKGGPMIISYEKAANNIDLLKEVPLDVTFLDEAQKIKNPSSGNKRKLKLLNSRVKFAMTGTPIENSIMDLWSIFDFIFEGYLYSHKKFKEEYGNIYIDQSLDIDFENEEQAQEYDEAIIEAEIKQKSLIKRIKPFILRRRKDEELSHILKEKKVIEEFIELTLAEKKLYDTLAEEYKQQLKEEKNSIGKGVDADGDLNDGNEEEDKPKNNETGMKIFKLIQDLKALTSLPNRLQDNNGNFIEPTKSIKFKKILLDRINKGDRILVFSSFLEVLDNAGEFLNEKKINFFRIDGSMPASERQQITKEFNSNEEYKVVLISLKAGAAGLNLVGANVVIHYDLWWNPSIENQANDRAYRIGQEKNVEIIKLVCSGTIEEKILNLQKKKQDLFDIIIEGAKGSPSGMTTQKDLEELIN